MLTFLEQHKNEIAGILSCFDRVLLQGTVIGIHYADAMTSYFYRKQIRIFDFTKWAQPLRDQIRKHAEECAAKENLEIQFIRKTDAFKKEQRVQEIIAERGSHPGLVHIFSAMESCSTYKPWHDKATHKTFFKYDTGRCLHYYFYFIDEKLGLCHLRVPTWAPFRLQFYFNGHNWLARQLNQKRIAYTQHENAFVKIEDFKSAQKIANLLSPQTAYRALQQAIKSYCPTLLQFERGIYWSINQAEYATDVLFRDPSTLRPIYDELVRTLVHAVKPDSLSMFLGKRLDPRFQGEMGSKFSTRIEGYCLRHFMGKNGIKMYDKFGMILRIETISNDISFFKHYRRVEHRDGTGSMKMAGMRKVLGSLTPLAEAMSGCNRRYLEFLSQVDDPTNGIKNLNKISRRVRKNGRSYRGFNLMDEQDELIFHAIAQANLHVFGIRSKLLRSLLPGISKWKISHAIRCMRNHGILKRVGHTYKYYLTKLGRLVVATGLKLKEMFLIPSLRGHLNSGE